MENRSTPDPLISVIVPVYNVAGHVGACLASLRAQTFTDFEVIVIDDGSTDTSPEEIAAAQASDARISTYRQDNGGLSAARNAGLDRARGRFIAFVDSDDRVDPDYLGALHACLETSGGDWVACAIRSVWTDGHEDVHSAIHTAPEVIADAPAHAYPLSDWRNVICHFPSAWNKLYRASLIEGLRFDEGTYFEDHAFFHAAARRTDTLLHLPRPLYLQTRGRPGQITAEASERVFEQLTVLDRVEALMDDSKTGARQAFGQLASRVMFERSTILREPDLRARFARASAAYLDRHGLRYDYGWDAQISPAWGVEMAGDVPISVVIPWDGQTAALDATLKALEAQTTPGFEVLVVCDRTDTHPAKALAAAHPGLLELRVLAGRGAGPGPARNTGLGAARGVLVVFLDAGDRLMPWTLAYWGNRMLRRDAKMGLSRFRVGWGEGAVHSGFHDAAWAPKGAPPPEDLTLTPRVALALHCHPSAKIFSRAFLQHFDLRFGDGPFSDWQMVLRAAMCAGHALYFDTPGAEISEDPTNRRLWRAQVPAAELADAIDDIATHWPPRAVILPYGWEQVLLARALWEKLHFSGLGRIGRLRLLAGGLWQARRFPAPSPGLGADPYIGTNLPRLVAAAARVLRVCIPFGLRR